MKINPASFFAGNVSLFYERAITLHTTGQLGMNFMQNKYAASFTMNNKKYSGQMEISGFGITPEIRYYVLANEENPAPKGVFLGGYLRYMSNNFLITYTSDNNTSNLIKVHSDLFSIGAIGGYQFIIAKNISADIFLAPNMNFISGKVKSMPVTVNEKEFDLAEINYISGLLGSSGIFPGVRAGFTVGIAF